MSRSLHELSKAALALDPADRLRLATELIDSVDGAQDPRWAEAWADELSRRSRTADAREAQGEQRGASWETVRERLKAKLSET